MNENYELQIRDLMRANGWDESYGAEIMNCSNMNQVYKALSNKAAVHVALLTTNGVQIENTFEFIKEQLADNREVPIALFFEKA